MAIKHRFMGEELDKPIQTNFENLAKEDLDFIDRFCRTHSIPEGKGNRIIFAEFIVEYKEMKRYKGCSCPTCLMVDETQKSDLKESIRIFKKKIKKLRR